MSDEDTEISRLHALLSSQPNSEPASPTNSHLTAISAARAKLAQDREKELEELKSRCSAQSRNEKRTLQELFDAGCLGNKLFASGVRVVDEAEILSRRLQKFDSISPSSLPLAEEASRFVLQSCWMTCRDIQGYESFVKEVSESLELTPSDEREWLEKYKVGDIFERERMEEYLDVLQCRLNDVNNLPYSSSDFKVKEWYSSWVEEGKKWIEREMNQAQDRVADIENKGVSYSKKPGLFSCACCIKKKSKDQEPDLKSGLLEDDNNRMSYDALASDGPTSPSSTSRSISRQLVFFSLKPQLLLHFRLSLYLVQRGICPQAQT